MSKNYKRYNDILRYVAFRLTEWRYEESISISEMVTRFEIKRSRIRRALLAKDWDPTMSDLAHIECEMDTDLIKVLRD